MPVLEAAAGIVVGFVVGLLGGGGAVLTLPLLVSGFGVTPVAATTVSLAVVAAASVVALAVHARTGTVRWRTGLVISAVGVAANAAGSLLATVVAGPVLLVGFAALLVVGASRMIWGADQDTSPGLTGHRRLAVVAFATVTGFVTGLLGVGGGFLVVPGLVLVLGFPVAAAVATSLLVLVLNAVVALAARALLVPGDIPWSLLVLIAGGAAVGAGLGALASRRVPAAGLRRGFGLLLLAMAGVTVAEAVIAW